MSTEGQESEHASDVDVAWAEEIEKRIRSIDDGSATLLPWDDVMHQINDQLK